MNSYGNTSNGAGLLKKAYPKKGATSQLNDLHPQIHAIRKRRDALKST